MSNFSKYDATQVLREAFDDSADALKVTIASSSITPGSGVPVTTIGKSSVATFRRDYTLNNVNTSTWIEITSSMASAVTELEIFDSSGQTLEIGFGGSGSESRKIYVFPGGNDSVPLAIPSGTRVSLRAVSGTANAGEICINFFG